MHSTFLAHGVLIPCASTGTVDPRLDFFAGTVAGVYILSQWMFMRIDELILSRVCIRLFQEWPP